MKIIRAIKDFDWQAVRIATALLLMCVGAIALWSWFANPLRVAALVASIALLALMWFFIFRLVVAVKARTRRENGKGKMEISASPRSVHARNGAAHAAGEAGMGDEPKWRRRFAYFDAEKGEDVYTRELVSE